MVKCPVCEKEINELDESCPHCHTVFYDMVDEEIKEKEEPKAQKVEQEEIYYSGNEKTNADCLKFMANLNIVLSVIGSILIWCFFSTTEIVKEKSYFSGTYTETVANWYGIIGGFAVLIAGFTLFFLLKTIVDIYWKVEKYGR